MTTTAQAVSPLLTKIRDRGHWQVIIHPDDFVQDRFPIESLFELVNQSAVALRGWNFPQAVDEGQLRVGLDWVELESAWFDQLEYWRMYQSGQFVDYAAMAEDWQERARSPRRDLAASSRPILDMISAVYRFTEIFEFAARLASSAAYSEVGALHIEINVRGLLDRQLVSPPARAFHREYVATIESFPYAVDVNRVELIARARQLAIRAAEELFSRFQWHATPALLREIQEELRLR